MTNKKMRISLCLLSGIICVLNSSTQVFPQGENKVRQLVSPLQILKQSSKVRLIAVSPDSKLLATVGSDGLTRLWNVQTRQFQQVLRGVHSGYLPLDIAFSPDMQTLVVAGDALELWNIKAGTHRVLNGRGSFLQSVAFSPKGGHIATGSGEAEGAKPRIVVRNSRNGQVTWSKLLSGKEDYISTVKFSPDGRILVNVGSAVKFWDAASGKLLSQLKSSKMWGRDISFSQDGKLLLVAFEKRSGSQINVYDAHNRRLLRTISMDGVKVRKMGLSPKNKLLICSNDVDGEKSARDVRVWNFADGQLLQQLIDQSTFALSSDGELLVTGKDNDVSLWRIK